MSSTQASAAGGPPQDPYPVAQRTVDLKCDSVYLRIRLCAPVPTPRTSHMF